MSLWQKKKMNLGVHLGLCCLFLVSLSPGQGEVIWHTEPLQFFIHDVFMDVPDENASLVEKIIFIESNVCGGQCADRYPEVDLPWETRFKPACAPCFCDQWCVVFQDCCPDLVLTHTVTYTGHAGMSCYGAFWTGHTFEALALIDRCPVEETGVEETGVEDTGVEERLRANCEDPDMTRMEGALPVSVQGLSYRNIYCARCHHNHTVAVQPWGAEVKCGGTAERLMENATSRRQVMETLLTPQGAGRTSCRMRFTLSHKHNRKCRLAPEEPLVSSCDVSRDGLHPREELALACASYTSVFKSRYKNMFCYLCSLDYPISLDALRSQVGVPPSANQARTNFAALLDFGDVYSNVEEEEEEEEEVQSFVCPEPEFYDGLRCECRRPECHQGKYLTSAGSCEPMVKYGNTLGYRACAFVNFTTGAAIVQEAIDELSMDLHYFSRDTAVKTVVKLVSWCPGDSSMSLKVEAFLWHTGSLAEAEKEAGDFGLVLRDFLDWSLGVTEFEYVLTGECRLSEEPTFPCPSDPSFEYETISARGRYMSGPDPMDVVYFVDFSETTKCPWVHVTREDLNLLQTGSLELNSTDVDSISGRFESNETSQIQLCVSEHQRLFSNKSRDRCGKEGQSAKRRKNTDEFDRWTPEGLVSIVSSCISLLFLSLTFLVYLLLPSVRAGGGKNIMALTVVLFIAQALYEFAIEQYENETACQAIGVLIHFSWLASVFSMNACTVERFYKLSFPLKSRSFFMSNKPFWASLTYFLTCSLLIVGLNIALNLIFRDDLGYGGNSLCYINSPQSRVFAFALPMGVVVLVNILLLVLTVCSLKRASHSEVVRSSSSERSKLGLVACVRLSAVTGLMWLVAFLYEAVPSDALAYVFTALIGLQGVLFFFSLVVNKRVLGLLREFAHASVSSRTSSSGRTYESSASGSGRRAGGQKGKDQGLAVEKEECVAGEGIKMSQREDARPDAGERSARQEKGGIFSNL